MVREVNIKPVDINFVGENDNDDKRTQQISPIITEIEYGLHISRNIM